MSEYITKPGDGFEKIARQVYGDETLTFIIAAANPGAREPFVVGTSLIIPADITAPRTKLPQSVNVGLTDVTLAIDGEVFYNWERLRVTRSFDSIDTFSFSAPFEPDDPKFRETFKPFSFKEVVVFVGEDRLFTGTMVDVVPVSEAGRTTTSVSGYSKPGVLGDCTPPAPNTGFQYEFNDLNVVEIAHALGIPFGVKALGRHGAPGAVFAREAIEPQERVLTFLAALAKQQELVISSDEDGDLIFQKEKATPGTIPEGGETLGTLAATFSQNEGPINSVIPVFNAQQFYSHVTAFQPVVLGLGGETYPVKNPRLSHTLRPYNFIAPDTQGADVLKAANGTMGRMYANAVAYTLEVRTWRNAEGKLWKAGEFISIQWPEAMIFEPFTFFIRRVNFRKDPDREVATLTIILPGGYAGKIPEVLPWDS